MRGGVFLLPACSTRASFCYDVVFWSLITCSNPPTHSSMAALDVRIDNLRVFGHMELDELARQRQVVESEFAKSKQELGILLSSRNHGAQLSAQAEQRGRELQRRILPRLQQTLAFLQQLMQKRVTPGGQRRN